jgi:hypothetical protein
VDVDLNDDGLPQPNLPQSWLWETYGASCSTRTSMASTSLSRPRAPAHPGFIVGGQVGRGPVVVGQLRVRAVEFRVVEVGLVHPDAQVVRHYVAACR